MLTRLSSDRFEEIYKIMKTSFPFDEIRGFDEQKALLQHKNYKLLGLLDNDSLQGFIAIWEFEKFILLEHFAICPKYRNKGLGEKFLSLLLSSTTKKIILEVDYPTDDFSKRRINFYKRNSFELFDFNYIMPAYSNKHNPVPLLLMSNSFLNQVDYDDFYDKILNIVNFS